MISDQIEVLREKLNLMIESDNRLDEELLKVSQELDSLIMEFMREKYKELGSTV